MGGKTSKGNVTSDTNALVTIESNIMSSKQRIVQNFLLIWMDVNLDASKLDFHHSLTQLRNVVNHIHIFTQPDECIQFLNDIKDEKVFIITSGSLGQHFISHIHDLPQIDVIYIFCHDKLRHEEWIKDWVKIKGIYTCIEHVSEALTLAAKQCNQDSLPVSFVTTDEMNSNTHVNQLEPSYMYTQIFKEILLDMKYDQQSITHLADYCRRFHNANNRELNIINEFENSYDSKFSIWWYTRECFLYQMLNRALRQLEGDTIINMGFFIHDLHKQIEQLHQQQIHSYFKKPFIVYRGQGLSTADFDKLCKSKGGLISFNNFLSTSTTKELSLRFAVDALNKTDTVGILFKMTINPSISSTPYASIEGIGYYKKEEEILFSMHTVFRIDKLNQIDNNKALYEVDLRLTADDDEQLRTLTNRIREEVVGVTGWQRLGTLLLMISQLSKAEELYTTLLEQTSNPSEKALYYNQLGCIKNQQGDYAKAIEYYEKSLEIFEKTLPPNHSSLATSYGNIGLVYGSMGEYAKALSFYEKSLEIGQQTLSPNHPSFATSYNNMAGLYENMDEHSKALSYYQKSLEIYEQTLPANHPDLASSYSNIGLVYDNMEEYSKALWFYEKALEICQRTLPPNHSQLATSYNNIGAVYYNMGEYSKALSFYEKSLKIDEKTLPSNHPHLAVSYKNIGMVYDQMGEHVEALSYLQNAF